MFDLQRCQYFFLIAGIILHKILTLYKQFIKKAVQMYVGCTDLGMAVKNVKERLLVCVETMHTGYHDRHGHEVCITAKHGCGVMSYKQWLEIFHLLLHMKSKSIQLSI